MRTRACPCTHLVPSPPLLSPLLAWPRPARHYVAFDAEVRSTQHRQRWWSRDMTRVTAVVMVLDRLPELERHRSRSEEGPVQSTLMLDWGTSLSCYLATHGLA